MLDKDNLKHVAMEAGISGGIAYLAGSFFLSPSDRSLSMAMGGIVAGASVISNLAHDYVLNYIPKNEKYKNIESSLINAGVIGASSFALERYFKPVNEELMFIGTAIGCSVLGHYVHEQIKPLM